MHRCPRPELWQPLEASYVSAYGTAQPHESVLCLVGLLQQTATNSDLANRYWFPRGSRRLEVQDQSGLVPSEGVTRLSPSFWWLLAIFGIPHLLLLTPVSAFISTWYSFCVQFYLRISSFHKDSSHIGFQAHPIPIGPQLITSAS